MARKSQKLKLTPPTDDKPGIYDLEVALLSGPLDAKFVKKNRSVTRTIAIRGDQTLEDLHDAIFDAFDRFDPHMYEFQVGGKKTHDPKARRYVLPVAMDDDFSDAKAAGDVEKTTIDDVGLNVNEMFGYWFDFGDDWWHQVTVLAIRDDAPGEYPKVIAKKGASPPQYPDMDEDGDEDA